MRSISSVVTALLIVAALAAPSALARPAEDPVVAWPGDQPSASSLTDPASPTWPVDPQPIASPAPQPAPSHDGFPWETLGLVLVASGIGLAGAVAVVRIRRRTHLPA
jgi:hypothetical protein